MMTEIRARITYSQDGQEWTRGEETFLGHSNFGDYLTRNAERIKEVCLVSIGETAYNRVTSRKERQL
jgi:hypothetical protein